MGATKLLTAGGGGVTLDAASTATDKTITVPADNGTLVYANSSGNVGIGNTAPLTKFVVGTAQTVPDSSTVAQFSGAIEISPGSAQSYRVQMETDSAAFYLGSNTYYSGGWQVYDNTRAPAQMQMVSTNGNSYVAFFTSTSNSGNGTERMRIDSSGNLLVGKSTYASNQRCMQIEYTGQINVGSDTTATYNRFLFQNPNGTVGTIQTTGSSTSYNTSSDYRLKENIQPMTGALAKVAALKPCTYKWKADGSDGEGFIAHELQEVVPDCVSGEKDAVNEDGSIKPQGIDTSFLVATLTAAIQELKTIVDAQAARIEALENK